MKLHFHKIGTGSPLIILHGLFGSSDNWQSLGKKFAEASFSVYLVDLRNHGHSPHSSEHNYQAMSEDVLGLIKNILLPTFTTVSSLLPPAAPVIIGHSMGGKTAMQLALNHPEKISKLIVVDVSPKKYLSNNHEIAEALFAVDLKKIKARKDAEKILSEKITDFGTRQLLLKGLYWEKNDRLNWRFNLKAIHANIEKMNDEIFSENIFDKPVLFIRGEKSNYVSDEDIPLIKKYFPFAEIKTAPAAGHWVHADNPEWMLKACLDFMAS